MFNQTYAVAGLYPVTAREDVGTYHVLFYFKADCLLTAKALFVGYGIDRGDSNDLRLLFEGKPVEFDTSMFEAD